MIQQNCLLLLVLYISPALLGSVKAEPVKRYSFYKNVTPENGQRTGVSASGTGLTLNGEPLQIISGALHYFRVVPEYWENRLALLKASGCNAVETYVSWNLHEPSQGTFDYDGILNLRRFIEIAGELDLMVIFRPGPYICAEWEFGGLPSWLLADDNMKVRTLYPAYQTSSDRYLEDLIPRIADLQFSKTGGPIIMVQIENEYGGYGSDRKFVDALGKSLIKSGVTEMLFTSDGPKDLENGRASNVWLTVNEQTEMGAALDKLEKIQPGKPLMVMEYWSGWFDRWTEHHHTTSMEKFTHELTTILQRNASVNFYMFHGGTNFGFMNGANMGLFNVSTGYQPTITSYDYDALISEDGRLTPKWHQTKKLLGDFGLLPEDLPAPVENPPAKAYGKMEVNGWYPLESLKNLFLETKIQGSNLLPMEKLNFSLQTETRGLAQSYGYITYETRVDLSRSEDDASGNGELVIEEMHDRALVLIDYKLHSVVEFDRSNGKNHMIQLTNLEDKSRLTIMVENMGRVNYGRNSADDQRKGLMGKVTFNGHPLSNWTVRALEFTASEVNSLFDSYGTDDTTVGPWTYNRPQWTPLVPGCFHFTFQINEEPRDTFLSVDGWGRGVAFVNKFNLGRYWPSAGPTRTLYVPAPLLKRGSNTIILFEQQRVATNVESVDRPNLGPERPETSTTASISTTPSSSPSAHAKYVYLTVMAVIFLLIVM